MRSEPLSQVDGAYEMRAVERVEAAKSEEKAKEIFRKRHELEQKEKQEE